MWIKRVLFFCWRRAGALGSRLSLLAMLLALSLSCAWSTAAADGPLGRPSKALETIRHRGEIAIGVKADFAPFGMRDSAGKVIGFEVDLAQRLADKLGVRLRLVVVSTENRFQWLEQGAVDLIIATAGDTQERRALSTPVEPNYYGAGVNVLLRPDAKVSDWQDLRGKPVCALQGSYFNKPITQRYIIDLQYYRSVRDAQLALKDGRCIAFLYTDVAIDHYLKQPEWANYKAPFPSALIIPWAMSLSRSERGSELEFRLGDIIAEWHRSGEIIALEKQWGIRPSKFLQDARALWSARDANGGYVCQRNENGQWPTQCRNQAFVTSAEVEGVHGVALWIRETFGFNFSIFYDRYDGDRYARGLALTMALGLASLIVALLLGYWGAKAFLSGWPAVRPILRFVGNYGRMTPPLLQMYLLFFGLGSWLTAHYDIVLSPFAVATWCFGAYHGCIIMFMLIEAAEIVQSTEPNFRLRLATFPEVLRLSNVGVRSALSNLIKATGIASAIAVPELLSATIAIIADQGNPDVMMSLLLVIFYVYSAVSLALIMAVERRILNAGARP